MDTPGPSRVVCPLPAIAAATHVPIVDGMSNQSTGCTTPVEKNASGYANYCPLGLDKVNPSGLLVSILRERRLLAQKRIILGVMKSAGLTEGWGPDTYDAYRDNRHERQ